jgi:hypothetical protein
MNDFAAWEKPPEHVQVGDVTWRLIAPARLVLFLGKGREDGVDQLSVARNPFL